MISVWTKTSCIEIVNCTFTCDNIIYISRITSVQFMWALIGISPSKWPLNIEKVMFILQLCRFTLFCSSQCFSKFNFLICHSSRIPRLPLPPNGGKEKKRLLNLISNSILISNFMLNAKCNYGLHFEPWTQTATVHCIVIVPENK